MMGTVMTDCGSSLHADGSIGYGVMHTGRLLPRHDGDVTP